MWNPFNKQEKPNPSVNRVDEFANALQGDDHIQRLEEWLNKFDLDNCTPAEKNSWHHLYGIISFQLGDDAEALRRFDRGHKECPDFQPITFSLGQQCIRSGDIERAFNLFGQCRFPELPRDFNTMIVRYAYLFDQTNVAIDHLKQFLPWYKQLKILDDTFLYIRGMPFFGAWLDEVLVISMLQNDFAFVDEVIEWMNGEAHDYDEESILASIEYAKTGDYSVLARQSQDQIERHPNSQMPMGFHHTRVAIGKARSATSHADGVRVLDELTIGSNDHRWLDDMLVLAKYEVAGKFDMDGLRDGYESEFMARQALLFEPNLALSFGMVGVQEELKHRHFKENR